MLVKQSPNSPLWRRAIEKVFDSVVGQVFERAIDKVFSKILDELF
ncbi:hypothetical protein CFREI_08820 [Corynebacterium freiburgense]|nr:hypothetical protein CFREI_08820 [Corynebacterium freiburgense]